MKCTRWEKIIYLFEESDPAEQRDAEEHIRQCASCRALMEQVNTRRKLSSVSFTVPELDYPGVFTSRVMTSLEKIEKPTPGFFTWSLLPEMKHAFAVVSVILIGFFVAETYPANTIELDLRSIERKDAVVLNSSAFLEQVKKNKSGVSASLMECFKVCEENTDEARCIECRNKMNKSKSL